MQVRPNDVFIGVEEAEDGLEAGVRLDEDAHLGALDRDRLAVLEGEVRVSGVA